MGLAAALPDARLLREPGGVELSRAHPRAGQGPGAGGRPARRGAPVRRRPRPARRRRCGRCSTPATTVLLDRFVDSSLAYQGAGRALGIEAVRAINDFGTGGLPPDITLLLRIDPAAGRARQAGRGEAPDRLELEEAAFFDNRARLRRARGRRARALPRARRDAAPRGGPRAALEAVGA